MSYAVVVTEEALHDLQGLPVPVQQLIEYHIRRLATDPVRLSKPSTFPYVPSQAYRIHARQGAGEFFITVLFRYGPDETAIEVFAIASTQIGGP